MRHVWLAPVRPRCGSGGASCFFFAGKRGHGSGQSDWSADVCSSDLAPPSWDADQDRAARATVVETPAGRVVPSTRPHALEASVRAMFEYRPAEVLARVEAPIVGLAATSPLPGPGLPPMDIVRLNAVGHNLMRYRPDEVTAAILGPSAF